MSFKDLPCYSIANLEHDSHSVTFVFYLFIIYSRNKGVIKFTPISVFYFLLSYPWTDFTTASLFAVMIRPQRRCVVVWYIQQVDLAGTQLITSKIELERIAIFF